MPPSLNQQNNQPPHNSQHRVTSSSSRLLGHALFPEYWTILNPELAEQYSTWAICLILQNSSEDHILSGAVSWSPCSSRLMVFWHSGTHFQMACGSMGDWLLSDLLPEWAALRQRIQRLHHEMGGWLKLCLCVWGGDEDACSRSPDTVNPDPTCLTLIITVLRFGAQTLPLVSTLHRDAETLTQSDFSFLKCPTIPLLSCSSCSK